MARASLAAICSFCLLLAGGCGGGKTQSTGNAQAPVGDLKTNCERTAAAQARSHQALAELGLDLTNKPLLERALAGVQGFAAAAEGLQRSVTGAERADAGKLVASLQQQANEIKATIAKDEAAEQRYGRALNPALVAGRAAFARVCAHS
jgi:hypothetical protein